MLSLQGHNCKNHCSVEAEVSGSEERVALSSLCFTCCTLAESQREQRWNDVHI